MAWYKDWFRDANYNMVYEHRDEEEAERMLNLIEHTIGHDASRRVLDLGCGSGRHTIAFAKRGYPDVTGVDLSPALLREAREECDKLQLHIRFFERDMRDVPDESFDLILNLFTSFGYFEKDEENSNVIENAAKHLSPTGWFILDFLNSHWVREHFVTHDERMAANGIRIEQSRWIENNRIEKRVLIRDKQEAKEYIESVRLFELLDFQHMFADAKLTIRHCFGTYTGQPFEAETSPRLIMFASA